MNCGCARSGSTRPGLQQAYDAAYDAMLTALARRDRLDRDD